MATSWASKWKNDPHSLNKEHAALTSQDEAAELLDEPYAQAVLLMDYKRQDVLQAIKTLQKRSVRLTAEAVMHEVMKMETRAKHKGAARDSLKRAANDHYGSDGESEDGSLENVDAPGEDDLQTDGEAAKDSMLHMLKEVEPAQPPMKKANLGKSGKMNDLRLKLLALRDENRRLKARQLCRKCQEKPVSLTFLPCGHFSFCVECGQGFQACPICHKTILADVKTFLA